MKKMTLVSITLFSLLLLSSCGGAKEGPMTETQQAEKYGMSVAEFKEQKDAAARMNMTIEDHLSMPDNTGGGETMEMDMGDDSSMIEDDSEETMVMPEGAHKMPDGSIMNADGSTVTTSHTMADGTTMKDSDMHMEMMHKDDEIEDHDADKHGEH